MDISSIQLRSVRQPLHTVSKYTSRTEIACTYVQRQTLPGVCIYVYIDAHDPWWMPLRYIRDGTGHETDELQRGCLRGPTVAANGAA